VGVMTLEEMEEAMVRKALEKYNSNISQTAKSLGLTRQMLYRRMEKYGFNK
jgi:transcriptional regulator with PAS, ATPase and Fis domain